MNIDVAILGAGHNGLVAAAYLARAGLKVQVFERRSTLGGATLSEELWPGYTFSTGAHLLHAMPAKIFRDLGLRERGLQLVPRDHVIFLKSDGTYDTHLDLDLPHHRTAWVRLTADERAGLERYNACKHQLLTLVRPNLLTRPPTLDELRARAAGTPAAETLDLVAGKTLWELQDHFLPTERLRERFASEVSAVACDPSAWALVYGAIDEPDPVTGEPAPQGFVRGGMGRMAEVLTEAAREAGAELLTDRSVTEIKVTDGRVTGVHLADGREIAAGTVLSCTDPKTTFLKLLAPAVLDPGLRRRVAGLVTHVSCYKLLAAISELPEWNGWDGDPELPARGSVQLEMSRPAIRAAYADLAAGRPPARPMLSFNIPSMLDPSLAPEGRHTASLYVYPAPARLAQGSWEEQRTPVAERLIDQITEYAPNFRRSILHYEFRTPLDLERRLGLTDGCIWHIQHTGEQLLGNRPLPELAAYRAPITGLYLGGAGQHPGGEVSGIPGHNAAHEILRDLSAS